MEQVQLGSTGLRVSRLCLGMMSYGDRSSRAWFLPEEEAETYVRAAADAGITFFDTADVYSVGGSEVITGNVLRRTFSRREDYVLATKVWGRVGPGPNDQGLSRGHILDAVDASLRRLGVDHIDLYQIHRWDPHTPIEETMETLHDVVRSGKVRYIGASSMWAWQFSKAQWVARTAGWTPFVSMQNHLSLLYREEEREMLPLCVDEGVAVLPWSPLARGRLARPPEDATGTVRGGSGDLRPLGPAGDAIVDVVGRIAQERGVSRAEVALAWVFAKPEVTAPIVGVTKPGHLEAAVAATQLVLTPEEIAALEAPYQPREIVGHE